MDFDAVVDELYQLAPSDFVAVRDQRSRQARQAGDRDMAAAIQALRRPSVAAWVINLFARRAAEDFDRLFDLGDRLRHAQESLSAEEIRILGRQRHHLVAALTREAGRMAGDLGHPISDPVEREVQNTLDAALADPVSGAAARSGRLVRSLTYAGIGSVDLEGAVAALRPTEPSAAAVPPTKDDLSNTKQDREAQRAIQTAQQAATAAAEKVVEAEQSLAVAAESHRQATDQAQSADDLVRQLERQLAVARASAGELETMASAATTAWSEAENVLLGARGRADEARAILDSLRRPPGD